MSYNVFKRAVPWSYWTIPPNKIIVDNCSILTKKISIAYDQSQYSKGNRVRRLNVEQDVLV